MREYRKFPAQMICCSSPSMVPPSKPTQLLLAKLTTTEDQGMPKEKEAEAGEDLIGNRSQLEGNEVRQMKIAAASRVGFPAPERMRFVKVIARVHPHGAEEFARCRRKGALIFFFIQFSVPKSGLVRTKSAPGALDISPGEIEKEGEREKYLNHLGFTFLKCQQCKTCFLVKMCSQYVKSSSRTDAKFQLAQESLVAILDEAKYHCYLSAKLA